MATRPTLYPEHATTDVTLPVNGVDNKIRPDSTIRDAGWDQGQKPTAPELNWQLNNLYDWIVWLDQEEQDLPNNYYNKTELDGGQLDNRYYTETEIDTNIYTKTELDAGQLDNRYYTETEIDANHYTKTAADSRFANIALAETVSGLWNYTTAPTISSSLVWHEGITTFVKSTSAGSYTFPGTSGNSLILKWGSEAIVDVLSGDNSETINFNTAFPTALLIVVPFIIHTNATGSGSDGDTITIVWNQANSSTALAAFDYSERASVVQSDTSIGYIAIGY